MKTFLVQTVQGQIKHDFAFHLLQAVDYHNWYQNEKVYDVILSDHIDIPNVYPIGSLEFVFSYLEKHFKINKAQIAPLNVPEQLRLEEFLKREYQVLDKKDVVINQSKFVKSATQYKSFMDVVSHVNQIPEGVFCVSEVVEIQSEWRAFVFKNELVGLQHYLGDFCAFPNVATINTMIAAYTDCPPAYTLDVGINQKGTFVIEIHPFVSCGLYGFQNNQLLPVMFITAFHSLIQQTKNM
jgi:hypothetical protein